MATLMKVSWARRGLTLVEILMVSLLLSLVIGMVMQLLFVASQRFRTLDAGISMAMEASTILNGLRQDVLAAMADPALADAAAIVGSTAEVVSSGFALNRVQDRTRRRVTWQHDADRGVLVREVEGKQITLGQGFVASFSLAPVVLTAVGERKILTGGEVVPADTVRLGYRVTLLMDEQRSSSTPGSAAKGQTYQTSLYPVQVNRQLHSIWRRP